jgi:hypothetical protein
MSESKALRADGQTIKAVVEKEWLMFTAVNESSGVRASCQDDRPSFLGMRESQFAAWSQVAVQSYLEDLQVASEQGRNPLAEKYLYMMLVDSPILDESYLQAVPVPTENKYALCEIIMEIVLRQTQVLREQYPALGLRGRPLYAADGDSQTTSIQTYQLGELLTYSESTLFALMNHMQNVEAQGGSTAEEILTNETRFYGYRSLEQAEQIAQAEIAAAVQAEADADPDVGSEA